jgi:exodeoxyribonuclease VII large subunit
VARKKAVETLQFDFGLEVDDSTGVEQEPEAPQAPRLRVETPASPSPGRVAPLPGLDRRVQGLQLAREALASGRPPDLATEIGYEGTAFPESSPGSAPDSALSVAAFYERLRIALRAEFPDEVWVTGEIRKVTVSKGHRYIELADHEPSAASDNRSVSAFGSRAAGATLEVACWSREWPTIAAALEAVGVQLTAGLVVRVRGRVSVWEAGARIRFSMTDLDVEALVGGIAAARRKLLTTLQAEGLIDANRRLTLPLVPLRVGLVTSAGSEAYRDFTGQLQRSGLAFKTRFETSLVQGVDAPAQIAAAIQRLQEVELDLIVVVRGGGAKGDLAAFDHEVVARAIVSSRYPIWTGIGHTGDRSVADEIAHRALVTPTACGEAVVDVVVAYLDALGDQVTRILNTGVRAMDGATRELASRRSDLSRAARHELSRSDAALARARARAERGAKLGVERCASSLSRRSGGLASLAAHHLSVSEQRLAQRRAMLDAFDPKRQLERGWSLTRGPDGSIVRSVAGVAPGDELLTVVADGTIVSAATSIAERLTARPGEPAIAKERHGK